MADIANGYLSEEAKAFSASLYSEETPSSVEQALKSEEWKNAMDVEIDALMRNETWEKCVLPHGKKP
nr:putative reverse transcriptase, RNA-dependent DNA polymerase [Tanacetum cinerariifolium]